MPPPIASAARLRADLDALAEAVESAEFRLAVAAREPRRAVVGATASLVRRYLLPRLDAPARPLLVAVFGPTGSGKSTVVNALAGQIVSAPGALRPTTRHPVAWCHHRHTASLERLGPDVAVVADDHPLLAGATVVDTPDLDSYVVEHADRARAVLEVADAAIYVTTPQRYADAVPWEVVSELVERRMALVVVANRLSRRSSGAVADLASLLRDNGMDAARAGDIVRIQEQRLRADGRLPRSAVERLRQQLVDLSDRAEEVVAATVDGAIGSVLAGAVDAATAVDAQQVEAERLREAALLGYRHQSAEIESHLESGDLVRGEVVARWQRMVGVTDLAAIITRGWGRVRDLLSGSGPVEPDRMAQVGAEARRELAELALVRAQRAVTAAVTAWEVEPGARALITDDLRRTGADLPERATHEVDEWMAGLVTLVAERGRSRFRVARMASLGINATATILLLGVFASTGGITGAEVGVAAGTAAAQQTVLEHLFGSAAAARLAASARRDLAARLGGVLEEDARRFERTIEEAVDPPEVAASIRSAVDAVSRSHREVARGRAR